MIGVIFSAAMSSISGEINSLATVTVIDVYKRYVRKERDRSPLSHAFPSWPRRSGDSTPSPSPATGSGFGALIEKVNMIGSLFYGGMLGVFVLAFAFQRVSSNGAFYGVLAGEAAIFAAHQFTGISYLWYNVIGCFVVILTGLLISAFETGGGIAGTEQRSLEAR